VEIGVKTFFVSGHLDLTGTEFDLHYVPALERAFGRGVGFVLGDGPGADALSQAWLDDRNASTTVFHTSAVPRRPTAGERCGGFRTLEERDAAMTAASQVDIAWIRPGTSGSAAARNLARRTTAQFVEVERIGGADWNRFRSLRLSSLGGASGALSMVLAEERAQPDSFWIQRVEDPSVDTLVATRGGRDVGVAVVTAVWDRADCGGLEGVWVAEDARGHGVGDALITRAVECARRRAHRRLLLEVSDQNAAALRLYIRQGFLPTGRTSALPPPREHMAERELERLV